jgi:O-acetyl-ADP-ribose deacetylase (regulator of RNase III)
VITFVKGNLFANEYKAQAFAHGVNCIGVMGAGIATQFKKFYPAMFAAYRQSCLSGEYECGGAAYYNYPLDRQSEKVINLMTQYKPGRFAKLEYVADSFDNMKILLRDNRIKSVAMPAVGCGLGGLNWIDVKFLMVTAFADEDEISVYAYEPHAEAR